MLVKSLFAYMRSYKKECILGPLFKLLEATFELLVPLVMAAVIDVGIARADRGYVGRMCLVMAGLGVVAWCAPSPPSSSRPRPRWALPPSCGTTCSPTSRP